MLCTVWGMAPMLDLAVWIGAMPVFRIRQVLTPSFSDVSARPTPARWRMRAGMDELRGRGARMTTSPTGLKAEDGPVRCARGTDAASGGPPLANHAAFANGRRALAACLTVNGSGGLAVDIMGPREPVSPTLRHTHRKGYRKEDRAREREDKPKSNCR